VVPAPTAAAVVSMAPATTWTDSGRPRWAAAAGESGPITSVQATIGGSLSRSMPQSATSAGEYRTFDGRRLSVTQDVRIESTVATVRPVSFRLIQSSTLRNVAVRS
jgi:hypothetical protein